MNVRVNNYAHFAEIALYQPHGVIAFLGNRKALQAAHSLTVPVVNVSAGFPDIPFPTVTTDNVAAGKMGAEHLLSAGLQSFAFARSPWTYFSELRQKGFGEAILAAGGEAPSIYVINETEPSVGKEGLPFPPSMGEWLQTLPLPCGIMTDSEETAKALLVCADYLSIRVPEDMAVITTDQDEWFCELANPPLSCVPLPGRAVGWRAAEMLTAMLEGKAVPTNPVLVVPDPVIVRQSSDVLSIPDESVCRALRFIRDHGHQRMTVPQVVRVSGTNRRTLELRFRRYLNRSLLEEIHLAHLQVAQRLLRETLMPMDEVAEKAGFSSAQRMTLLFKKELELTPLVYRKKTAGQKMGK